MKEFKARWNIAEDIALHGNEIRSKKENFAWLGTLAKDELERFFAELGTMLVGLPIIVQGCVVSRPGYLARYFKVYGKNTWEMRKSAFGIVVERSAKFVLRQGGVMKVYFEKAGKVEDRSIVEEYKRMRDKGLPFDASKADKYAPLSPKELSEALKGIEGKGKANEITQVADLILHPVSDVKLHPGNRAFGELQRAGKIIDCLLSEEDIKYMGIKYFCFDAVAPDNNTANPKVV